MNTSNQRISGILLLLVVLMASHSVLAQEVLVNSANPTSAIQGTLDLNIEIAGEGFDNTAEVTFLVTGTEDTGGIVVKKVKVRGSKKIIATIDIEDAALVKDFDIAVSLSSGRGGKGTTLFKVESKPDNGAPCNLEFEASFDNLTEDGLSSDGLGSYTAGGGEGFRLDTNGSIKIERQNDTRFVNIDFLAAGDCDPTDVHNPTGAAGFCSKEQGVDLRIEHQVQERYGLCNLEPGESVDQAVYAQFEAEAGGKLENVSKNGRTESGAGVPLTLNYGCLWFKVDPDVRAFPAVVTRLDHYTWRIEGDYACLHTNLGQYMTDESGNIVYLYMPFGLTIVDVNAPN